MNKRLTYQAAGIAAVLGLVGIVITIVASFSLPSDVPAQPYAQPMAMFTGGVNDNVSATLLFFAGDTLFSLSYLMVFGGLFAVTREHAPIFAWSGLGLGALTALIDSTENAFFISYALFAHNSAAVSEPAIVLVAVLTTLKWTAAFGTLYAFGLVFPRHSLLEKFMMLLMIAFPIFGAVSVAAPDLILWRGLFLLVGMVLFAVYFWQQAQKASVSGT